MAYKQLSPIIVAEGGTGAQTLTDHAVLIGSGTGAITAVGPVASTGALLASNGVGSDPGFTTATYPLTTTVSEILYSSATNTVTGLTTANNGTLITSATGVPSLLANGTTGQVLTATTGAPPSWAAAAGDVSGPGSSTDRAIATWNGTNGDTLFDNSTVTITSAGEMTNTTQPAFQATSSAQNNVTGDGTLYVITFTTEIFDQNNDFDGTSTFTAPVTGRYNLIAAVSLSEFTTAYVDTLFITSNGNYYFGTFSATSAGTGGILKPTGSILADMDSGDTATVDVQAFSGTKTVDVTANSRFMGFLVC